MLTACAGGATGTQTQTTRRSSNTITSEEISAAGVTTLYDAIQRLRPHWLTSGMARSGGSHTDEVQVYLETAHYGTIESLRQLPIGGVQETRLLSAADATNQFGTGNTSGAIVVVMARQP
jgi:hypothetical protein